MKKILKVIIAIWMTLSVILFASLLITGIVCKFLINPIELLYLIITVSVLVGTLAFIIDISDSEENSILKKSFNDIKILFKKKEDDKDEETE